MGGKLGPGLAWPGWGFLAKEPHRGGPSPPPAPLHPPAVAGEGGLVVVDIAGSDRNDIGDSILRVRRGRMALLKLECVTGRLPLRPVPLRPRRNWKLK